MMVIMRMVVVMITPAYGDSANLKGDFLCLCFHASLIYISNCPTRCNTKHSIYYSASSHYRFRVSSTPIIRSTQIVTTASGTASLATLEGGTWSCTKIWPVPEAVVTVLCTPDDGCGWHPKHVEWTCRIINRLLCVASHWTVINWEGTCSILVTNIQI